MKWLLVFYLANGANVTYRYPFPSRAECEVAQSLATARYQICEAMHPGRVPALVATNCVADPGARR